MVLKAKRKDWRSQEKLTRLTYNIGKVRYNPAASLHPRACKLASFIIGTRE